MTRMPETRKHPADPRIDPLFIETERNRFGARALGFLIVLNGAAALVLLSILARAPEATCRYQNGCCVAVFQRRGCCRASQFVPRLHQPDRCHGGAGAREPRRGLQIVGIVAVIGSAVAFLTGMNMVAAAASERSSSHPKGPKQQRNQRRRARHRRTRTSAPGTGEPSRASGAGGPGDAPIDGRNCRRNPRTLLTGIRAA